MKSYEEMARDVLKRRDEELQKLQQTSEYNAPPEVVYPATPKKRRLLPKIAIPCAAAVTAAAVGLTVWNKMPQMGELIQNNSTEANVSDQLASGKDILSENKINILDYAPEYLKNQGGCITGPAKHIPCTLNELNELYGIEFDRLGRLHKDWEELISRQLGIIVRDHDGESVELSEILETHDDAVLRQEIITPFNTLNYKFNDNSEISVDAVLIGIPEDMFSPFDSSVCDDPDIVSVINGKKALIYYDDCFIEDNPGTNLEAIIEMGKALVKISAYGDISEEEFLVILDEYTNDAYNNTETPNPDDIKIHDTMPEYFEEYNPFSVLVCGNFFDDLTFEPYADAKSIGYFYGIDFDRLTRLYSDWNEQHGDFGIYSRTNEEENSYGIVWTRNSISYELPNGSVLTVEAERELDLDIVAVGKQNDFSTINGFSAMIYRDVIDGDVYDAKLYPRYNAVIQMGKAVVHISAAGLSEDEFVNVLREYTYRYKGSWPTTNIGIMHDAIPDNFKEINPFEQQPGDLEGCDFEPYTVEQLYSCYGKDIDYLTLLHSNWKEQHGELGIYTRVTEDGEREPVWTRNSISYELPNGASITVEAQLGSLPDLFGYATIGSYKSMIYREGDARFGAVVDTARGSVVRLSASGLTEEEFINILEDYIVDKA